MQLIDTSTPGWAERVEALAGTNAIHAVMDLVGGDFLRDNLRVLTPRGRLCVIGLTAGNRTEIDLDGTQAAIGRTDTVTAASAQDPAVTSAQTISCGDVTIAADGVQQPQ